MVFYFCHCLCLRVCPGEILSLDSRLASYLGKTLFFWLSACSVLIVVPLLKVRPSFSWYLGQKVLGNCIDC